MHRCMHENLLIEYIIKTARPIYTYVGLPLPNYKGIGSFSWMRVPNFELLSEIMTSPYLVSLIKVWKRLTEMSVILTSAY
jgi:hypothetical protein